MTMDVDRAQGNMQLVVFDLANEAYGIDIGAVREIIRLQEITRIPRTPPYVQGVTNLRGRVIPVIDLRKRLLLATSDQSKESRIVVADIGGQDIGLIVDEVTEVLRISADAVEPPSSVISGPDSVYIIGIGKLEHRLIILLDLEQLLSDEERHALNENSLTGIAG